MKYLQRLAPIIIVLFGGLAVSLPPQPSALTAYVIGLLAGWCSLDKKESA